MLKLRMLHAHTAQVARIKPIDGALPWCLYHGFMVWFDEAIKMRIISLVLGIHVEAYQAHVLRRENVTKLSSSRMKLGMGDVAARKLFVCSVILFDTEGCHHLNNVI